MTQHAERLVLFDGVCNLCSSTVRFIIQRDPEKRFRFASLQSPLGQRLSGELGLRGLDSIILLVDGKAQRKSSAALEILRTIGGPWTLMYVFFIVPVPARDWVYDFVGNRRYRWFGKTDQCWIPDRDISDRFLDASTK